jgi:2-haloalkanoic acid dehalogenase type II
MKPMLQHISSPLAQSKRDALLAFEGVEVDLQNKFPTMLYSDILAHVHAELKRRLAHKPSLPQPDSTVAAPVVSSYGDARVERAGTSASADEPSTTGLADDDIAFGKSIPNWPVFPDTIPALAALAKHYKLAVLSNVDLESFSATREILERSDPENQFTFDAVYTAQDIGSYKPNPANFKYALAKLEKKFGFQQDDVLVVAASLAHDHAPANQLGIKSAYIARAGASMSQNSTAKYDWKFPTLGAMAEQVQKEAGAS